MFSASWAFGRFVLRTAGTHPDQPDLRRLRCPHSRSCSNHWLPPSRAPLAIAPATLAPTCHHRTHIQIFHCQRTSTYLFENVSTIILHSLLLPFHEPPLFTAGGRSLSSGTKISSHTFRHTFGSKESVSKTPEICRRSKRNSGTGNDSAIKCLEHFTYRWRTEERPSDRNRNAIWHIHKEN